MIARAFLPPPPALHRRNIRSTPQTCSWRMSEGGGLVRQGRGMIMRPSEAVRLLRGPEAVFGVVMAGMLVVFQAVRGMRGWVEKAKGEEERMRLGIVMGWVGELERMVGMVEKGREGGEDVRGLEVKARVLINRVRSELEKLGEVKGMVRTLRTLPEKDQMQLTAVVEEKDQMIKTLEKDVQKSREEYKRAERESTQLKKALMEKEEAMERITKDAEGVKLKLMELGDVENKYKTAEGEIAVLRDLNQKSVAELERLRNADTEVAKLRVQLKERENLAREELESGARELQEAKHLYEEAEQEIHRLKLREETRKLAEGEAGRLSGLSSEKDEEMMNLYKESDGTGMPVGDGSRSDAILEEIAKNIEAESLALGADVKRAEVESRELSGEKLLELDRVTMEMEAEEDRLRAGLRKAEAAVERAEEEESRKRSAVEDVMELAKNEEEAHLKSKTVISIEEKGLVARQAKRRGKTKEISPKEISPKEASPKKRKGRSAAAKTTASSAPESGTKSERTQPKKRGRPRKSSSVE